MDLNLKLSQSKIIKMDNFLSTVKEHVVNKAVPRSVTVVLGNESCDLDSAVSSLVLAFFLYWKFVTTSCVDDENAHLIFPVLNVAKDDLPIKTEVVYALKKYHLALENIICIDEVDFQWMINLLGDQFKVILVDHHVLEAPLSYLLPYVTEILDHRPKDETMWKYENVTKATITTLGSCATLVTADILSTDNGKQFLSQNPQSAALLKDTIILDTVNFSPSADKARPLDVDMVSQMESLLNIEDNISHRNGIFETLLAARVDYSSLNSSQLLRRDLKVTTKGTPIPGFPFLVKDFLNRDDAIPAMKKFCNQYKANTIVMIGLIVVHNKVRRDIAIFAKEQTQEFDKIVQALKGATNPALDLEPLPCRVNNCVHFLQHNVKASRKQILPIVNQALK